MLKFYQFNPKIDGMVQVLDSVYTCLNHIHEISCSGHQFVAAKTKFEVLTH